MDVTLDASPHAASTEQQASGSSFYAAMRLLPPAERAAMFAIYAFCRVVDDIADDAGADAGRAPRAAGRWRADLAALYAGAPAGADRVPAPSTCSASAWSRPTSSP